MKNIHIYTKSDCMAVFHRRFVYRFFIYYIFLLSISFNFVVFIKYENEEGFMRTSSANSVQVDFNKTLWFGRVVNSNISNLLKFLFDIHSFLVDIQILNEIESQSPSSVVNLNLTKYENTNSLPLVFGIDSINTHLVNNEQIKTYGLDCDLLNSYNDEVISNIYLNCTNIRVQIAVFHKRGEFLFIGKDNSDVTYSQKDITTRFRWFGDVPRAFHNFKLNTITSTTNKLLLPSNVKRFLFDYGNSEFIECDHELVKANSNISVNGKKYEQNMTKNAVMMEYFKYFTNFLEENQKRYWLFGGTLLGWYRDCGIIPHTSDMDVGLWASEYNPVIKQKFLRNQKLPLVLKFGFLNDSLELRLFNKQIQIDMFFVYKLNSTFQLTSLHADRQKMRRWLPEFSTVCSAELFQHKVLVPCNPVEYLNLEYNETKNWITPTDSGYPWHNLDKRTDHWTDEQWPRAIKYYGMKGFEENYTLDYINEHLKKKLKTLPKDDDE